MRCLPKSFEHRRQRRLRGARAFRMTAHAVDHHQQHRVLRGRDSDPVLIFLAVADEAHVRGLDLQCLLLGSDKLRPPIMADFSDRPL